MSVGANPLLQLLFLAAIVTPIITFFRVNQAKRSGKKVNLTEDSLGKFGAIFVEPTERYIASIGNGYIINFLAGSNVASGFAVVSNKRVYFKGKCYYKEEGKLKKSFEERTVDLKDVTGTGYTRTNPLFLLITAIVSFLVFVISAIVSFDSDSMSDTANQIGLTVFLSSLVVFSITITSYLLKRHNLFEIAFAGGKIAFDTNLYDKTEIDDFQKQLRRAKDHIVESAHSQVAAAAASQVPAETNSKLGIADEIKKYSELLQQKLITQEEFDEAKKNLLFNSNK
ncbi:hypothetical protein SAMN03159341_1416 [Paenibacillus sp. 1_12]|uniref:SHOCT domain-containing protein n=1 Tax=Paenibacillus sp. 1_12 TaxID=1566278 RepID=UPI0008ED951E|nr:SHOCT domain-containing protein [Paenibacillus sp. 1_12]SFM51352.1 hypothetical protein SAMN03159341_1416 [Paenibacillus sp. 1_12]